MAALPPGPEAHTAAPAAAAPSTARIPVFLAYVDPEAATSTAESRSEEAGNIPIAAAALEYDPVDKTLHPGPAFAVPLGDETAPITPIFILFGSITPEDLKILKEASISPALEARAPGIGQLQALAQHESYRGIVGDSAVVGTPEDIVFLSAVEDDPDDDRRMEAVHRNALLHVGGVLYHPAGLVGGAPVLQDMGNGVLAPRTEWSTLDANASLIVRDDAARAAAAAERQ